LVISAMTVGAVQAAGPAPTSDSAQANTTTEGGGTGQSAYFVGRKYSVRRGDSLWGLADQTYAVPYYWPHIWNHNESLADPDRIAIDDVLWLPMLHGAPGNLTPGDRHSIAQGYYKLYRHFEATGDPHPEYALVGARYFDPSVLPPALRDTASGRAVDTGISSATASGPEKGGVAEPDLRTAEAQSNSADTSRASEDSAATGSREDSAGVRVGTFRLNAGLGLSRSRDDNLFATRTDPDAAWYTTAGPWLSLESDWNRHALGVEASVNTADFSGHSDENYTDSSVRVHGRYDLAGGSNVFGSLSAARAHEDRTAVNVPGAATEPTVYRERQAVIGTAQRLGDTELRVGFTDKALNFDDVPLNTGGTANNDDRDRREREVGGRLTMLRLGGWQPFVQAAADDRAYDRSRDDFGYARSSDGGSAAVGATRAVRGGYAELFAGYMSQQYDDSRLGTVQAPDFGARLKTILSPHTRLDARVDHSIDETTLPGAAATLDTTASATLEHRVSPRATFSVPAYWLRSEFARVDRTDDVTGVGLTLTYRVTPHVSLYAGHAFERRDSSAPNANYEKGTTFAGLSTELAAVPVAPLAAGGTSGPYLGVQTSSVMATSAVTGPRGPAGSTDTLESDAGDRSSATGLFAGYGWSLQRWLVALELEVDQGDGSWDHKRGTSGNNFTLTRQDSYAGSARLGYWLDSAALLYGRAGLASTEYRVRYKAGNGGTADVTDKPRGVRFGAGMELALSDHWFGRFDWSYTDYHPVDVNYGTGTDSFAPTDSTFMLGLGYRFFDGGAGRAPRREGSDLDGPYIGVALGRADLHTRDTGDQRGQTGSGTLTADRAGTGPVAGLFGGYGVRFGSLYLGAEAEADRSNAGWDSARLPDRRVYGVHRGAAYGLGGRVGYVVDGSALVYLRASRMRTDVATKYTFAGEGVNISNDRTLHGTRTGIGVEVPASRHLFVRLDYSHTNYDSYSLTYQTSTGTGTERFDNDEDLFQLGLGYRF